MDKKIRVATLIPVYNDEKYIIECLESVVNQKLNENVTNDIFVCSNKSNDKSDFLIRSFYDSKKFFSSRYNGHTLIKIEQNFYQGIVPTRNKMIQSLCLYEYENNEYDFIANQDSDDVWIDENKLQKQIDYLNENKDIDILGTQYIGRIKNKETKPEDYLLLDRRPLDHDSCINWLFNGHNPIGNASVLFRRKILYKIGSYDDIFPYVEDMWFWYKAALAGFGFANLEDNCVLYNMSANPNYSDTFPQCFRTLFNSILDTRKKI